MTTNLPDYADEARRMVRERRATRSRDNNGTALNILLSPMFNALLNRACRGRRMNRSAYTRRALAVQLASDLDLTVLSVLEMCPLPVSWKGRAMFANNHGTVERIIDDGTDIESWCPHPNCDGKHFR